MDDVVAPTHAVSTYPLVIEYQSTIMVAVQPCLTISIMYRRNMIAHPERLNLRVIGLQPSENNYWSEKRHSSLY